MFSMAPLHRLIAVRGDVVLQYNSFLQIKVRYFILLKLFFHNDQFNLVLENPN
jgi:hypothetical protein